MSPPSNTSSAVAGLSIAAAAALAGFTFAVAAARSGWLPEELLPSSRRRGKRSPKVALGPGITPAVAVKAAVLDSDSDDDDEEIDGAAARSLTATPRSNGNGYGNGATSSSPPVPAQLLFDENDEVVKEQLTRNRQFFGAGGQRQLAASLVVVVGLGGVGSHAGGEGEELGGSYVLAVDELSLPGLWATIRELLEARLPLQGTVLTNKFGRPATVPKLPASYVLSHDRRLARLKSFSHSPVTWFRLPFAHLLLVSAGCVVCVLV